MNHQISATTSQYPDPNSTSYEEGQPDRLQRFEHFVRPVSVFSDNLNPSSGTEPLQSVDPIRKNATPPRHDPEVNPEENSLNPLE